MKEILTVKRNSTPRVGGGESHMKGAGMLVVSFRGANLGFWTHLGCSVQNVMIIFRRNDLF